MDKKPYFGGENGNGESDSSVVEKKRLFLFLFSSKYMKMMELRKASYASYRHILQEILHKTR